MSVQDKIAKLKALHAKGIVAGLKDVSGVLPRKDIDVYLSEDPDSFNLFLLALEALKKTDKKNVDDRMSYFEVAGQGKANMQNIRDASGYCAHGIETFPTWHRPYLAMFEAKWTDQTIRQRYFDAALRFRLPYWDYFRPREETKVEFPGVISGGKTSFPYNYRAPLIVTEAKIKIRRIPSDEIDEMDNPLIDYDFPDGKLDADLQKAGITTISNKQTVRYPPAQGTALDSKTAMNQALNSVRMDANRIAVNMLVDPIYANYDVFATNKFNRPVKRPPIGSLTTNWVAGSASGSLEAIHGTYHVVIGGDSRRSRTVGGHMSRVPVAAFDPVFWLHHNQVERMFTIWQASRAKERTNWFVGTPDMADDKLWPFRKPTDGANSDFWSSNDCVSSEVLGYTFEEARGGKDQVVQRIRDLYEWSIPLDPISAVGSPPDALAPIDVSQTQFFKKSALPAAAAAIAAAPQAISEMAVSKRAAPLSHHIELLRQVTKAPDESEKYSYEWFVDDEVQRLAMNGAFTIYYFINQKPGTSAPSADHDLMLDGTMTGLTHIFASPVQACDNCGYQEYQGEVVSNTNAITSMLLDYVEIQELQSLTPEHVVPFLQDRLRWRIVGIDGDVQDARRMSAEKEFRVNVSLKKAELPRGSGRATYEEFPQIIEEIVRRAS